MGKKSNGYSLVDQVFGSKAARNGGIVRRSISSLGRESNVRVLVNEGVGRGYAWTVVADQLIFDCSGDLKEGFCRDLYNHQTFPYETPLPGARSRKLSAEKSSPVEPFMANEDAYQKLRELTGIARAEARLNELEKQSELILDNVAEMFAEALESGCEIKQCDHPELASKIEKKLELIRSSRSRSREASPATTTHCGSEPNLRQLAGNHLDEGKGAGNIARAPTAMNISNDCAITYGHIAT